MMAGPRLYDTLKQRIAELTTQLEAERKAREEAEQSEKELRRVIERGRESNATELALAAQLAEQRDGNIKLLQRAEAAEHDISRHVEIASREANARIEAEAKFAAVEAESAIYQDYLDSAGLKLALERIRALNQSASAALSVVEAIKPKIVRLLTDTINEHSDPGNAFYNQCETDECQWCATAKEVLDVINRTAAAQGGGASVLDASDSKSESAPAAPPVGTLGQFDQHEVNRRGKELREAELRGMEWCAMIAERYTSVQTDYPRQIVHAIRGEIDRLRGEIPDYRKMTNKNQPGEPS